MSALVNILLLKLCFCLMFNPSLGFGVLLSPASHFLNSQRIYVSNNDINDRPHDPLFDNHETFSYVEGSEYENEEDELIAMGGDPSFLKEDEKDDIQLGEENDENYATQWSPTDGNGPKPKPVSNVFDLAEWDGTVDESAHLD